MAGEAFRRYQRELLDSLRTRLPELAAQRGAESVTLSSLGQDFVRYVRATDGSLYPAVAPLILSQEQVTAPMRHDAQAIEDYVAKGRRWAAGRGGDQTEAGRTA